MAALAWAALRFVAKGSKQLYLTTGYEIFLLLVTRGIPVAILPALTGNQDAAICNAEINWKYSFKMMALSFAASHSGYF